MWASSYLFLDIMNKRILNKEKTVEKIYSRNRLRFPKIKKCKENKVLNKFNNCKTRKIIRITVVLLIAFVVVECSIKTVEPIIDMQCSSIAKAIATKISNEQATKVMEGYKYEDFVNIDKTADGNIKLISANTITINQIISDIPILIQNELEKVENEKFYIRLGTFTGSKLLAGRGPKVEIKMSVIGDIETDLKSEFKEAGINQTLHRIYLEVKCNVVILTPINSITEVITNQVLLAEGVIVGNIPDTYYNLKGLTSDNVVDIIE